MVLGNIRTLPDVLSGLPIEVFNSAFLPTAVRVAEVERYAERLFQAFVVAEQHIIVRGNGGKLRELLLDVEQGLQSIAYVHRQDLADEADPQLPVCCSEDVP